MSFIKDSMKEFDHIVWPTASETKKYFVTVVTMITVLTVVLFIVGTALSAGIFSLKSQISPVVSSTASAPAPDINLGDIKLNGETTPSTENKTAPETSKPAPAPVSPVTTPKK